MLTTKQTTSLVKTINNQINVTEKAKIKDGWVTTNDLEVFNSYKIDSDAEGLVDAKKLKKAIDNIKPTSITSDGNKLSVVNGGKKVDFNLDMDVSDFPKFNQGNLKTAISLDTKYLKSFIPFMVMDELRQKFNGLAFTEEGICATDAYKMKFSFDYIHHFDFDCIIPRKAIEVLTEDDYSISFGKNDNGYKMGRLSSLNGIHIVEFRLIDENYVKFTNVIPTENPYSTGIYASDLQKAIKSAIPFANKTTLAAKLDEYDLITEDLDNGLTYSEELKLSNKMEFTIGFNLKFMEVIAKDCDGLMDIVYSQPNRAMVINGEYLLMPVMLS